MKHKYITLNIRMAFAKKQKVCTPDIHQQIAETLAERKRILQQLESYTRTAATVKMILTPGIAA
jgi:hypothetical protein